MMALYTSTLFTRGYGLSNDTRQIRAVKTINGQPLGQYYDFDRRSTPIPPGA